MALLQKLREGFEGYSKGVRALAVDSPFSDRIQGAVADMVAVAPEYVTAIEAALGRALECLIVRDTRDANAAIAFLRQGDHGAAAFLPLERIVQNGAPCDLPNGKGVVGWASDLLAPQRDEHGGAAALLRHTLLVQDAQTALVYSDAMRVKGVEIVTLSGEVFAADGTVYGGADATSESGLIGRQQQIDELLSAIATAQTELATRGNAGGTREQRRWRNTSRKSSSATAPWRSCTTAGRGLQRDRQNAEAEAKRQARGRDRNSTARPRNCPSAKPNSRTSSPEQPGHKARSTPNAKRSKKRFAVPMRTCEKRKTSGACCKMGWPLCA